MSRFLVFEGLDGSGKSSLMTAFEKELGRQGIAFHHTCEPGGTAFGKNLRPLILNKSSDAAPVPRAELLMYEADRAQHVEEILKPKLKSGWVLSDRYKASSLAFQTGGRSISEQDVLWLNQFATGGLEPDLTVLLDITVEQAHSRRAGRGAEDRIESEAAAFHERVRQNFLSQAKADPSRWLILSASDTPARLLELLLAETRRRGWLA